MSMGDYVITPFQPFSASNSLFLEMDLSVAGVTDKINKNSN